MFTKKNLVSLIVFVAYVVGILLAIFSKVQLTSKILTVVGLFSGMIIFLYDRTDLIFKFITSIVSKLSRDTVTWKGGISFELMRHLDFEKEDINQFKDLLEKNEFILDRLSVESGECLKFSARYAGKLNINYTVRALKTGCETSDISIDSEINCSYKDSKQNWEGTKQLFQVIKEFLSNNEQKFSENREKFSVKIIVDSGKNPFYKLSVSHLNAEIKYFDLKYNVGNDTTVIVTDKTLEASSSKASEIEKIIKNYVILSKVG